MNCPACHNTPLKSLAYENQEIDVCRRCQGVWFDKNELLLIVNRLLSKDKIDPQTIKEAYRDKLTSLEKQKAIKRHCPKCQIEMDLQNYSYDSNIIIDKCLSCGGIWTDAGEMRAVAKYIKGSPDMHAFAQSFVEINAACRKSGSKKGKKVAAAISLVYLGVGYATMGFEGVLRAMSFLLLPIAAIFFADEMCELEGVRFRPIFLAPVITGSSPPGIVRFIGWVYLIFVPIVIFGILMYGV